MRRGKAADFDSSKLQSGEFAVCEDTGEVFVKYGSKVKELTSVKVDAAVSSSSTNPVQAKVIDALFKQKAEIKHTHIVDDVEGLKVALDCKSSAIKSGGGIKYIGHRGLSGIAPENTIPSFAAAGTHGMWGAECDIWETSDGHFVVCHNETVDAATDGTGKIADKTLNAIKSLTIDNWNNKNQYPNLKMPTLEEYLDCCKLYGLVPVIEIKNMKTASAASFVNILKDRGFEDCATVISFDHQTLRQIRELSSINMQFLYNTSNFSGSNYKAPIDAMADVPNADIDIEYTTASNEAIKYAHSKGIKVNVWTVDSPTEAYRLAYLGVDFITTNILIDSANIPSKPVSQITVDSMSAAQISVSSNLTADTSTANVEKASATGKYIYNTTTGVLSINSAGASGVIANFGCSTGDVITVEYEYYAVTAAPKLSIGSYNLVPPDIYDYDTAWQPVRLAIPIKDNGSIDIKIGYVAGIFRLRNISIVHHKYHQKLDSSTSSQEWREAQLSEGANHYPGNEVSYCKKNGMVYIRGWFTGWTANSTSASKYLFMLPEGYRPGHEINITVPTSGVGSGVLYVARLSIFPSGAVSVGVESSEGGIAKGCSACVPPFLAEN